MFKTLSYNEFAEIAKVETKVTVFQEISGDKITPIQVYEALLDEITGGALLESTADNKPDSRYSYICLHPFCHITAQSGVVTLNINGKHQVVKTSPFDVVRKQLKNNHCYSDHPLTSLVGGAVGFLAYDAVRLFENIPNSHCDEQNIPDLFFKFYRTNVIFDSCSGKVVVATLANVGDDPNKAYQEANHTIRRIINKIFDAGLTSDKKIKSKYKNNDNIFTNVEASIDDANFKKMVKSAQKYIVSGDAFQIVLSRCFKTHYTAHRELKLS